MCVCVCVILEHEDKNVLCLILFMSGWSEVENEQRSGCEE